MASLSLFLGHQTKQYKKDDTYQTRKGKPVELMRYLRLDRSQNISLHFICITFHLHYITFAFKNRATSARNA